MFNKESLSKGKMADSRFIINITSNVFTIIYSDKKIEKILIDNMHQKKSLNYI